MKENISRELAEAMADAIKQKAWEISKDPMIVAVINADSTIAKLDVDHGVPAWLVGVAICKALQAMVSGPTAQENGIFSNTNLLAAVPLRHNDTLFGSIVVGGRSFAQNHMLCSEANGVLKNALSAKACQQKSD
jgi:hypothetical protein